MEANAKSRIRAIIAGKLLATQTAQIQFWKADDVDIVRLRKMCADIADSLVTDCEAYDYDEEES